jgi:hypothetical protein
MAGSVDYVDKRWLFFICSVTREENCVDTPGFQPLSTLSTPQAIVGPTRESL